MIEITAEVTSYSFDASLFGQIVAAEVRPLSEVATMLQKSARSMVLGSRRKSFSELTARERRSVFAGNPLPWAPSRPGEPPRSPTGKFRNSIFGDVDQSSNSAIAGATGGRLPRVFEAGGWINGHYIKSRPLMLPTLNRNMNRIPSLFEGLL